MSKQKFSIMLLPMNKGKLLLQSFIYEKDEKTWDGFGSFYNDKKEIGMVAKTVYEQYFMNEISLESFKERAKLNYLIDKPSGVVDLRVTVFLIELPMNSDVPQNCTWFEQEDIPYNKMHPATAMWLPEILGGNGDTVHADICVSQPKTHNKGIVTKFSLI